MQQHQTQTAQPAQSSQQQQLPLHGQTLSNIDAALEGVINKFVRSEKNARKFKYIVRGTSAPGRQNYKFPQATGLTAQETKLWRQNLMQDETASNNPFWTARWMRVFRVAPRLDDSLLKVPYVKCERTKAAHGDSRAPLPLHRKETYIDLRDEQNHNWAMDSYTAGIQNAQKGQLNNALKAYSQSIHIDSKFVEAYIARGCTLANMSKYKEAIMDFQQALSLQPGNDQARQYLESTIAQEEHVKRNPHQISANQAQSTPTQPGSGRAYYEKSNLDDINEIVMETDAVLINDMPGNDQSKGNKKKKKKKSKGKRVPDDIDRYQPNEEQRERSRRERDRERDRARERERERDLGRCRSRTRSHSVERNKNRSKSRDRDTRSDHNRHPRHSRRGDSKSRSPRIRSRSSHRSTGRPWGRSRSRSVDRKNAARSPVRNKSQHSPRKMSHSPLRRRAKSPAMKKQDTSTSTQPRPKSPVGQASAKHSEGSSGNIQSHSSLIKDRPRSPAVWGARQASKSPPRRKRSRSPLVRTRTKSPVNIPSHSNPVKDRPRSPAVWGARQDSKSPPRRKRSRSPVVGTRSKSPANIQSLSNPAKDRPRSPAVRGARQDSKSPPRRKRSRSPVVRARNKSPGARKRSRSPASRNRPSPTKRNRSKSPNDLGRSKQRSPNRSSQRRSRSRSPRRMRSHSSSRSSFSGPGKRQSSHDIKYDNVSRSRNEGEKKTKDGKRLQELNNTGHKQETGHSAGAKEGQASPANKDDGNIEKPATTVDTANITRKIDMDDTVFFIRPKLDAHSESKNKTQEDGKDSKNNIDKKISGQEGDAHGSEDLRRMRKQSPEQQRPNSVPWGRSPSPPRNSHRLDSAQKQSRPRQDRRRSRSRSRSKTKDEQPKFTQKRFSPTVESRGRSRSKARVELLSSQHQYSPRPWGRSPSPSHSKTKDASKHHPQQQHGRPDQSERGRGQERGRSRSPLGSQTKKDDSKRHQHAVSPAEVVAATAAGPWGRRSPPHSPSSRSQGQDKSTKSNQRQRLSPAPAPAERTTTSSSSACRGRERSRPPSPLQTNDESKPSLRRQPLPSQDDLRRAQGSGGGAGNGAGAGGGREGGGGGTNHRSRNRRGNQRSKERGPSKDRSRSPGRRSSGTK